MDATGLQEMAVFEGLNEIPIDSVGLIDAVGLVVGILFEGLAVDFTGLAADLVSSAQSSPDSE